MNEYIAKLTDRRENILRSFPLFLHSLKGGMPLHRLSIPAM